MNKNKIAKALASVAGISITPEWLLDMRKPITTLLPWLSTQFTSALLLLLCRLHLHIVIGRLKKEWVLAKTALSIPALIDGKRLAIS